MVVFPAPLFPIIATLSPCNISKLKELIISISLIEYETFLNNILLIDDYVDSRWTFTILGAMLSKLGHAVYPFSLAMVNKKG